MQKTIEIVLPFPLPTWNRILAMHPWERKKLRDWIHHAVSISIQYGEDWPTLTEYQGKLLSTESFMQDYYQMIRPNTSKKSATARKRVKKKKRS